MVVEMLELENATSVDGVLIHPGKQPCCAGYSRMTTTTTVKTTALEWPASIRFWRRTQTPHPDRTARSPPRISFSDGVPPLRKHTRALRSGSEMIHVGPRKRCRGVGPIATSKGTIGVEGPNGPAGKRWSQHTARGRIEARSRLLGS